MDACSNNDLNTVKVMISDRSSHLNHYNLVPSPIHIAVSRNKIELLEILLDYGFPSTPIGSLLSYPVHVAAENNFLDIL